jgi:FSR family fosmidomycin resistance protein-like MFS transporter
VSTAQSADSRTNMKAIGLVSGAHLYSHYFLLLLPPLFPLLRETYGVGFTELGLSITVLNIVTGLLQAPAGFLVDKVGARGLLVTALIVESLAFCVVGLIPTYGVLIAMMVVAGFANAIFHPADYAILNASVGEKHMGRAFSIHTAAGFFGGFLAPATAIPLAGLFGWEVAVVACAASGIVMAMIVIAGSGALHEVAGKDHRASQARAANRSGWALLLSLPVMMGLLFYVGLSTFSQALGNFSTSSLSEMTGAGLETLGIVLSVYLFANPIGVLAGGWVADKIKRHDLFTAGCLIGIAVVCVLIASINMSLWAIGGLLLVAGLLNGVVAPSRDMLVRAMTPPGEIGKVFGFVSTGFNVAGILVPPLFGYILDHSDPTYVFWLAGAFCLATVPTVLFTGSQGRKAAAQMA